MSNVKALFLLIKFGWTINILRLSKTRSKKQSFWKFLTFMLSKQPNLQIQISKKIKNISCLANIIFKAKHY